MTKIILKKLTSLLIMMSIVLLSRFDVAFASESFNSNDLFNEYVAQLDEYNQEFLLLNSIYNNMQITEEEYNSKKQELLNKIDSIKKSMSSIGVDNADKDFKKIESVLSSNSNSEYAHNAISTRSTTPSSSYFKETLSALNQIYDVYGNQYTYYNGVQNYEIYDIVVMFSAQKYNPAYGNVNLAKNNTKVFCDKFSSNSVKAQEWIKEILNIYVGKATSAVLDKIPGVKYLPYELLTNGVKPQPSEISSTGNALVVTLNTTTTIKFTYVGDSTKNTWTHCLTDNMVSYAVSYTAALHYKGKSVNKSFDSKPRKVYGASYQSTPPTAVSTFIDMQKSKRTAIRNGCIRSVAVKDNYGHSVSTDIVHVDYPLGMI